MGYHYRELMVYNESDATVVWHMSDKEAVWDYLISSGISLIQRK